MDIEVAGRLFACAGEIIIQRGQDGSIVEFAPQERYAKRSSVRLNLHGDGTFCRLSVVGLPQNGGVYLVTSDDVIRYVGKAANLQMRWSLSQYGSIQPKNCYVGGQSTNCRINKRVLAEAQAGRKLQLLYHVEERTDERSALETYLFSKFKPSWNLAHPAAG